MKIPRSIQFLSLLTLGAGIAATLWLPETALADTFAPALNITTGGGNELSNKEVYTGLKLSMLLSVVVFIPTIFMTVTCFPRIAIVLTMTRQALGVSQTPPNQVLLGMSLFLTFAIMGPVFSQIYYTALQPYTEDQITTEEALIRTYKPLREFMLPQTREQDLALFSEITKTEPPESLDKIAPTVLIPAFIISELSSSFQIAFLIYLPFLILDLVVSSVLTSMSMITLPPTVVSLPIKLMLFVIIDGWGLIIGNIVKTYQQ